MCLEFLGEIKLVEAAKKYVTGTFVLFPCLSNSTSNCFSIYHWSLFMLEFFLIKNLSAYLFFAYSSHISANICLVIAKFLVRTAGGGCFR